eukprot:TRINITY_DN32135_c0_g1_i1.p1 TRINITY_DN32135_c0_g1~~TRINITY_DN32135_c0_g1_i1.p1  ORF type:complete len:504 (-),score=103.82 TRINITY_DN32135_c0_g1_i1:351-1835(-)
MKTQAVVVRNTFLEVGDQQPKRSLRRQVSDPVHRTSQEESDDSFDDAPCSGAVQGQLRAEAPEYNAEASMEAAATSTSNAGGYASQRQDKAQGKGSRQRQEAQGKGGQEPRRLRDGQLSRLKNENITQLEPPWADVTTVMMRNLPNKYTQQMLLQELREAGFHMQADFDFFYLPMDHSNCANLGYCFINFTETHRANDFAEAFSGKRMRRFNSHKTAVIMPASIQGYEQNYTYYVSTRVVQASDPQYRPLFLRPLPDLDDQTALAALQGGKVQGKGQAKGEGDQKGSKEGKSTRNNRNGRRNGRDWDANGSSEAGNSVKGENAARSWKSAEDDSQAGLPQMPRAHLQTGFQILCVACGTVCGSNYRFCSYCGNFLGDAAAAGGPAMMPTYFQPADWSMMTDGQLAVSPMLAMQGSPTQPQRPRKSQGSKRLEPAQFQMQQPQPESNEAVAEELDILHGRMMLLAALKVAGVNDQASHCDTPMSSEDEYAMSRMM